jgi:hypothetical protein
VDAVEFGKARAAHVSVVSAAEVRALAPAHSPGTVNVVAVEPGGRSQISAVDRYTFGP